MKSRVFIYLFLTIYKTSTLYYADMTMSFWREKKNIQGVLISWESSMTENIFQGA